MNSKILKVTIAGLAIAIVAATVMFSSGASHAQTENQEIIKTESASELVTTDKTECTKVCDPSKTCGEMPKEECMKACKTACDGSK